MVVSVSSIPDRRIGTVMSDRLGANIPPRYVTSYPGQLSLLPRGTGYEYRPKCVDALGLGSKGRMAHSIRG